MFSCFFFSICVCVYAHAYVCVCVPRAMADCLLARYVFDKKRRLERRIEAHGDAVHSLHVSADGETLVSGGADGSVRTWDTDLVAMQTYDSHEWGTHDACVRSVFVRDDGSMVVGTAGADIFEVSPSGECDMVATGHFWGETWGLATHPHKHLFATAGDDGMVRTWALDGHVPQRSVKVAGLVRALAFNPDGAHLAIGMGGRLGGDAYVESPQGAWRVLDADTLDTLAEGHDATKWIQVMKYSPDGATLAVGSHDCKVYLYNALDGYTLRTTLEGHSSFITHMDFTGDARFLQTTSGDYELLFWDVATGAQRTNGGAELRDAEWASWTVPFGWPVQGIWPNFADGTDINSAAVSHNGRVVATADDFGLVKLFGFPAPRKGWAHDTYRGHSSHVMGCRWLAGDAALVTVGGHDRGVFVWRALEFEAEVTEVGDTVVGACIMCGWVLGCVQCCRSACCAACPCAKCMCRAAVTLLTVCVSVFVDGGVRAVVAVYCWVAYTIPHSGRCCGG